jgi:hypothetical protein
MKNEVDGKKVVYGGTFGKSLITKERFLSQWKGHLAQLTHMADTTAELQSIVNAYEPIRKMVIEKAEHYITEAEAEAIGIAKYLKD